MKLATKTLAAIDAALEFDDGLQYRKLMQDILPTIEGAYSSYNFPFSVNVGMGTFGTACARKIWYSFRWCTIEKFGAKMQRLFNRGHLEEGRMLALIYLINGAKVQIHDDDGRQLVAKGHSGHTRGALDGVLWNLPDFPADVPILWEAKTHNQKHFVPLTKKGVEVAHPKHYIQMQQYMGEMSINVGLYMATNKNTDELHLEVIDFDQENYLYNRDRVDEIVMSFHPPQRINESVGFFKCKFCKHRGVCHYDEEPERNCRTCRHARVVTVDADNPVAGWKCGHPEGGAVLDKNQQFAGCGAYEGFVVGML